MSSGYTVTRSNYTIKRNHDTIKDGNVYERDFMTTLNLGGMDSGSIPNSENGFKMVHRKDTNMERKHRYGRWLMHRNQCPNTPNGVTEEWTLCNTGNITEQTSESKIVLKPSSHTLLDYAYYGSCEELLRSSVVNIIKKFPAELFFTENKIKIGKKYAYIVDNPFNINIWDTDLRGEDVWLKNFSTSVQRYFICNKEGEVLDCLDSGEYKWSVEKGDSSCNYDVSHIINFGDNIEIERVLIGNKYVLTYNAECKATYAGYSIRPSDSDIEAFFDNLSSFEKVLLNRNSEPLYTCELDFPHETENGIETYRKKFTWPSMAYRISTTSGNTENGIVTHAYNIDISSMSYKKYINDLLELCKFYDERRTNNLWRMLTHDSIKHMDDTLIRGNSDEDAEDYQEGESKIYGLLMAVGRQFDEIKGYIDNIKNTNRITYKEDKNLPNYFLTDTLNLSGWEITSAVNTLNTENIITGLFKGENNKKYTTSDVNTSFLRNLKINSKDIFQRKGTKYGVEMILGLFGMISDEFAKESDSGKTGDYRITEHVKVASQKEGNVVEENEVLWAEKYNVMKKSYSEPDYDPNALEGLPVKTIYFEKDGTKMKCIIPWFDKLEKFDGGMYFQMFGGWGKQTIKRIDNYNYSAITGDFIYEETVKYLHIVKELTDLTKIPQTKLHDGDIFYVENASGDTNYYVIEDKRNSYFIGEKDFTPEQPHDIHENEEINEEHDIRKGWMPISETDTKVLYLESLIDDYRGNNPHVGYGQYDLGKSYFDYFEQLFKYSIDNDNFTNEAYECETGDLINEVKETGFNIVDCVDNVKCWFFTDDNKPNINNFTEQTSGSIPEIKTFGHYDTELTTYDMTQSIETGFTNSINHSYSVINSKVVDLTFIMPFPSSEESKFNEYYDYITQSVLPYVYQMIPSTTILNINFENKQ